MKAREVVPTNRSICKATSPNTSPNSLPRPSSGVYGLEASKLPGFNVRKAVET